MSLCSCHERVSVPLRTTADQGSSMERDYYLQACVIHDQQPETLAALECNAVEAILARFADEKAEAEPLAIGSSGSWEIVLGYIDGNPILFCEDSGFVELRDAGDISPRVEAFLSALCQELKCGVRVCWRE